MTALQDDLLRDILHTDPDRALKEAMASKQATSSVPMDHEPRMNVAPDQTINNDNISESNFSGQSVPEFQNRQNDHVFKMPQPKPMPQSRQSKKKRELKQEFNNIIDQLDKFPSADYYYELYLTKITSFHLRVTADVLDQSMNPAPSLNNLMGNTMMDCSSSASQYSSSRGFQGYHNSTMRNSMLNESMRSATTMINYTSQSHTVSSTTHTPPENQNGGAFLPPKPSVMNPCNSQPGPSAPNNQDMQETIRSMESAANTTQAGGGSFLGRPVGPAPVRPLNKDVENLRKSKEKNPSPLAKSSPVNQSVVQNSPINMNSTVNNTMNKSSAVNGTFSQRRKSDGPEVTLKNWTLRLDRSSKTKEPGLLLRGTIAKKCEVCNVNEPHESRPVQCRLSEYRVRTVDRKIYNLHGYFQNHSNEVPKLVTSFYMKYRSFPVQWRKMTIAWASASAKPVAEREVPRSHAEDSPLNSTMTRLKTKGRAKVRKTMSPLLKPVAKAVCKPVVNPVNKPLAKPFSRPVANPVSKPKPNRDIKHLSRKHATGTSQMNIFN